MPSPPKNRTVGLPGAKSCLVAIENFLGTEIQFPVEGDLSNGSIYVQNPPGVPIDVAIGGGGALTVENEPQEGTLLSGNIGISGGLTQAFTNIILNSSTFYGYDFTLFVRFDAGAIVTPKLQSVSCIPMIATTPPGGITLQPVTRILNLADNEGAVMYGPNLDQNNQGAIAHCRALRLGFTRDIAVASSSTIFWELVYTRRT